MNRADEYKDLDYALARETNAATFSTTSYTRLPNSILPYRLPLLFGLKTHSCTGKPGFIGEASLLPLMLYTLTEICCAIEKFFYLNNLHLIYTNIRIIYRWE